MKARSIFIATLALAGFTGYAQTNGGTVNFCNNSSNLVVFLQGTNPVATSDNIRAALYWAPAGSNTFVEIGPAVNVGVPLPGIFAGGTRTTGPATPGGAVAQFQVRAWGGTNNATYEQAVTNGAPFGSSVIVTMPTGNPGAAAPTPPTSLAAYGLLSFSLVQAPFIIVPPTNQTVNVGSNVLFVVVAGGAAPLSYQWLFNGSNIAGATTTSLTLSNVQSNQAGNYAVLVTNTYGSVQSSNALLTVLSVCTPVPSGLIGWWKGDGNGNDTVAGNNAYATPDISYTAGVVGQAFACDEENFPPFTYVGVKIADQPYYALTNALTIECWARPRGDSFIIFFRGDHRPGLDPYTLSMQGNNLLAFGICDQNNNSISVTAPLVYNRWWHVAGTFDGSSGTLSLYTNGTLAMQTNTTIRPFANLDPTQSPGIGIGNINDGGNNFPYIGDIDELGLYNRALSQGEVQAIYNAGALGKCPNTIPPVILYQPTNQTMLSGSNATFTVIAAGSPTLTYQWQFNGTNLVGVTGAALVLTNVQLAQAGSYAVLVMNAFGSILSSNAVLTVLPVCAPVPSGLIGWWKGESNGNDSVAGNNAYATPNITYTAGVVGQAFACNPTGPYTAVQIADQPYYELTNSLSIETWVRPRGNGFVIFFRGDHRGGYDPYVLSMGGNNVITFEISDQNNNSATVSAPLVTNQWWHVATTLDGASGALSLYTNGTLATQKTTTIRPFAKLDPLQFPGIGIGNVNDGGNNFPFIGDIDELGLYNRALSQGEVQAIYNAGALGKCPNTIPPVVLYQPTNQTMLFGSNATFTVIAAGSPTLTYQWLFNGTNLSDNAHINGSLSNILSILNLQTNDAGNYQVIVTNAFGSVTSAVATLTVLTPPQITVQPTNRAVLVGSNATFIVSATGSPSLSYQWWFNGTNALTANTATLTITNSQFTNIGGYSVVVTNNYGAVTSVVASLSVGLPPLFQKVSASTGRLTMTWNGATGFTYQVQYKTNLTQTNWLNLGGTIFATSGIVTGYDTIGPDPQRFYRVALLP